jgi:hypothetical protein
MKLFLLPALLLSLIVLVQAPAAEPAAPPLRDRIIADLIKQLDSDKFEERQQAAELLRAVGKPAAEPLKRVLEKKPSLEVATRVRGILRSIGESKSREVRERLTQLADLPEGIPLNSSVRDALDFLQERYGLPPIVVNEQAFRLINVEKAEEWAVSHPRVKGVPIAQLLSRLLGQVRGEDGVGTYVIRGDTIEITTTRALRPREWTGEARALAPRVHAEFDGEPLDDALDELAEDSGINIILDRREAAKGRQSVKARFRDVPLDTAVRLLADGAGLTVVARDNVLYVTSKKNAKAMEAELKKDEPMLPFPAENKSEPKDK